MIPPWNFPLAIPVKGVAAALARGNTVILKLATVAYPVAWQFAKLFREAGVQKDALQLFCADGYDPVNNFATHPSIKHIILTGGTDTAFRLLEKIRYARCRQRLGGMQSFLIVSELTSDKPIYSLYSFNS